MIKIDNEFDIPIEDERFNEEGKKYPNTFAFNEEEEVGFTDRKSDVNFDDSERQNIE